MDIITYGRIYFQFGEAPERFMTLKHAADLVNLSAFCRVLIPYSRAKITRCEIVTITWFEDCVETPGDFQSLDFKGIVKFRDEVGTLHALPIPAPSQEMFEEKDGKYAVKRIVGEAITEAYQTMAAQTFTYEHGWLVGNTY